MAAVPQSGTPWTIPISPDGTVAPAEQYLEIGTTDTIAFHNTASYAVNIIFTSQFDPINSLQPDTTSDPQGGTELNVTLNFTIFNAETREPTGGPYAVQIGTGALVILLSGSAPNPAPGVIPKGGQIQFRNANPFAFDIQWSINSAWSPQPGVVTPTPNPTQTAQAAATGRTVIYRLSVHGSARGGGTVTIGS